MKANAPQRVRGKALVWVIRPGPLPQTHEVLLLERPRRRGGGLHPVTGKADEGETPGQTAAREAREETGLTGALTDLEFEHRFAAVRAGKQPVEWVERAFLLRVAVGSEPRLSDEHVAHRWVALGQVAALLEWAAHRESLARAAQLVERG